MAHIDDYKKAMESIKASDDFIARTEQHMKEIRDNRSSAVSRPSIKMSIGKILPYAAAAAACAVIAVTIGNISDSGIRSNSTAESKDSYEKVDSFDAAETFAAEAAEDNSADMEEYAEETYVTTTLTTVSLTLAEEPEVEEEDEDIVLPETEAAVPSETIVTTAQTEAPQTAAVKSSTSKTKNKDSAKANATVQSEPSISEYREILDASGEAEPEVEEETEATPENSLDMDHAHYSGTFSMKPTEESVEALAGGAFLPEHTTNDAPDASISPSEVYGIFAGHDLSLTDAEGRTDTYSGDYADSLLHTLTSSGELVGSSRTAPTDTLYTAQTEYDGKTVHIYVGADTVTYETEDSTGTVYVTYRLINLPDSVYTVNFHPDEEFTVTSVPMPPEITSETSA